MFHDFSFSPSSTGDEEALDDLCRVIVDRVLQRIEAEEEDTGGRKRHLERKQSSGRQEDGGGIGRRGSKKGLGGGLKKCWSEDIRGE